MSLSTGGSAQPYQPYECLVCGSRFTRSENLKRHSALHTRTSVDAALPCHVCHATFSRSDLRNRHMKRKHASFDDSEQARVTKKPSPALQRPRQTPPGSFDSGSLSSVNGGDGSLQQCHVAMEDVAHRSIWDDILQPSPSHASIHRVPSNVRTTTDSLIDPRTPSSTDGYGSRPYATHSSDAGSVDNYLHRNDFKEGALIRWPSDHTSPMVEDWFPSHSQIARGFQLYFAHISHFLPFLHEPTFDASRVESCLVLSMLSLGFQYGEDPDHSEQDGSGATLSARCFLHGRHLIAAADEDTDDVMLNIVRVQAYLMLDMCAMLYLCGKDSAHGIRMHSRMISLARSGGLMQPRTETRATAHDLDSLWHHFIEAESHKRTSLAVHQIDALWYQILSMPRSISHLEIKHDLPCPEAGWAAPTASHWAHWQLVSRSPSSPPVPYAEAVRHLLSLDELRDVSTLPPFDTYGAINIAQFLISSAREISGWSAITGRISMERLEPLKASLMALGAVIRPPPTEHDDDPTTSTSPSPSTSTALCEATWETAMMELHMWSPSHTGGIVSGSIDVVVQQLVDLAPSCEFLLETNTARAIQPRIDWFLRYLDNADNRADYMPDREPPWLTLYAYKAFLVAWQLVRGGVAGAMSVVGVADGDVRGAVAWAREVLGRRARWRLGRLILASLEPLDAV